jgi:CHAT domain-containing protein
MSGIHSRARRTVNRGLVPPPPVAPSAPPRRSLWIVLAVALCCLALVLQAGYHRSPSFSARLAVAQERSGCRATAGRLDGLAHAPTCDGGVAAARRMAADELRQRARAGPRSRTRLSRGDPEPAPITGAPADAALIDLAAGHPGAAVSRLTAAGGPPARDAVAWNELAVADLELARQRSDPSDRVLAIEASLRSLEVDPARLEARFNEALALEELGLPRAAMKVWDDYLVRDRSSGWAAEAQRRRAALAAPKMTVQPSCGRAGWRAMQGAASATPAGIERLVASCPWAARDFVTGELLPQWAADRTAGRTADAARRWTLLARIGAALARPGDDLLIPETLQDVAAAGAARANRLATALIAYQTGLRALSENRTRDAAEAFSAAAAGLEGAGSPFSGWATLQHAIALYFLDFGAAFAELTKLAARVPAARYPVLAGRVQRMLGLICIDQANPAAALTYYENALAACARGHDPEYVASLHSFIAESRAFIGDTRLAWQHRQSALTAAAALPDSRRLQTLLNEVAEAALHAGAPQAARLIHAESLAVARRSHNPLSLFDALLRRIPIDRELHDSAGLEADRNEAAAQARLITDIDLRRQVECELQAAYARAQPPGAAAAAAYAKAVQLFAGIGKRLPLMSLLAEQARASAASGDLAGAATALQAGLAEAENQRAALATPDQRRSFFDKARSHFDTAVAFSALRRKDPDAAFLYAELGRSRTLLDAAEVKSADLGTPRASPDRRPQQPEHSVHGLSEIREMLEPGEALVEYSVVEGNLLRWTVRKSGADLFIVPITRGDLDDRVRAFRAALAHPPADARGGPLRLAQDLYRRFIPSALFAGGGIERLIVVPDRELDGIPFAALLDPATNRFLVEQAAVVVAPSASFYVRQRRRANPATAGATAAPPGAAAQPAPRSILVLGDPELDARFLSRFPRLPAARREAAQVAALYPNASLLLGSAASKRTFLARAADFEIIHYAGHSSADDDQPLLLLAGDGSDAGVLSGGEIETLRLTHTRLVVLATCRGGSGVADASEGPMSAARAFLAAGAPAVVASLMDLDDLDAEQLFITFHRSIARGLDPAAALRSAQLAAIAAMHAKAPSRRFDWAALQLVGGRP